MLVSAHRCYLFPMISLEKLSCEQHAENRLTGNKANSPLLYETAPLKEQQLTRVPLEAESRCSNRDLYKGIHTGVKEKAMVTRDTDLCSKRSIRGVR